MNILVTGGAGFIGSHVCLSLLQLRNKIIVIDNFINSHPSALNNLRKIIKEEHQLIIINGDITKINPLKVIFNKYKVDVVIHLAGLKSVSESITNSAKYYSNNVKGSINLFNLMEQSNCKKIIFSSSATVYAASEKMPLKESAKIAPNTPYGENKRDIENILINKFNYDKSWSIAILRFFNPLGAHKSGLIGENPLDKPNNLLPYLIKVAIGEKSKLHIFGDNYDTHDGTGIRDYIHVEDIASGHVKALDLIFKKPQLVISNLGTGVGYSVLDVLNTFERVTNQKIPYQISNRRPGDVPVCYSDPTNALSILNWEAKHTLDEMCLDAWKYILKNII